MFRPRFRSLFLLLTSTLMWKDACAQEKPSEAAPAEKKVVEVGGDHPPIIIEKPQKPAEKITAEKVRELLKKISPTEYELVGMKLDLKAGELRIPARMKIIKGPLEYLLVNERGAAHEALFVTKNNPFEVNVALLLMGLKPSETFFTRAKPEDYPQKNPTPTIEVTAEFRLLVEYQEKETVKSVPVESWVKNLRQGAALTAGSWVYTGSFFTPEGDLAALGSGNIFSLYNDPVALGNNPRQDNELDDNWQPMPGLPAEDSPVTIILQKQPAP